MLTKRSAASGDENGPERPELHVDDESSVRSSAVRGNFTSGRRPLGSSSSVLEVPNSDVTGRKSR